jgi:NTE family protein
MVGNKKFGLALSGGGYRAAAYHIGTLKKVHELGLLGKVDILSTISGGSITGAAYCTHKENFETFEKNMTEILATKSVIGYVLKSWLFIRAALFCLMNLGISIYFLFIAWALAAIIVLVLFFYVLFKYQFRILPLSRIIEKAYDEFFFKQTTLSQLCDKPEIAIGSTNVQTLRHFTFSKRKMEDSTYAYYSDPILFNGANFPTARAVMASSCVPFAFSPVIIDKTFYVKLAQAELVDPKLIDGGVYDNQGIHKLSQPNSSYRCDTILVSDAGNTLPFDGLYNNTITLLLRTVNIFMGRIKNFQMMQNIFQMNQGKAIAYQSLGWDIQNCIPGYYDNLKNGNITEENIAAHQLLPEWVQSPKAYQSEIMAHLKQRCNEEIILSQNLSAERLAAIRKIGTSLVPIKAELIADLIIHAGNLTELQLRLYCPLLF